MRLRNLLYGLLAVGLAACSSSDSPPNAPMVTLIASPESITLGQSSQLSWTVSGEDVTLTLEPPVDSQLVSPLTVSPTETTTYTLTATNSAGSDSDSVTITVSDAADPDPTASITAFTSQVDGTDAAFNWTLADAAGVSCTLDVGDGSALLTFEDCSSTTSYTHSYAQAGTFTATLTLATGASQSVFVVTEEFMLEDCNGSLGVSTQAELEMLSICTVIDGSLNLQASDNDPIISLAPLANLREVVGGLVIQGLSVTSLEGLENLETAGLLVIDDNVLLNSLAGLVNLRSVRSFVIQGNDTITSLAGLENLSDVSEIMINNNPSLESLAGLEGITVLSPDQTFGGLTISGNAALVSLEGLNNLTTIENMPGNPTNLSIFGNDALVSLAALANLTSLPNGEIVITANESLTSLIGLTNIRDYNNANLVLIRDNSALDCSLTPALPFVVDVSTGNLVDCALSTSEVVNTVYFLPPVDYDVDPIFNDAVNLLEPGEPVTVILERRGSSRSALTVALTLDTRLLDNLAAEAIILTGGAISTDGGQVRVRFAETRSRTTFTVVIAEDTTIITREDFRLNLIDAASYDLIEPATLRFRLEPPPTDDGQDDSDDGQDGDGQDGDGQDGDDDSGDDGQGDDGSDDGQDGDGQDGDDPNGDTGDDDGQDDGQDAGDDSGDDDGQDGGFTAEDCLTDVVVNSQTALEPLIICTSLGSLSLEPTAGEITSLEPLVNLTDITGALQIANTSLSSLAELANVTSVGGDITVTGNALLTSLEGLTNLSNFDDANTVIVSDNPALDCSLTPALPFEVDVSINNAVDCTTPSDPTDPTDPTDPPVLETCTGAITVRSQEEVDALNTCETIDGTLSIDTPLLPGEATITSLAPLSNLTEITGTLRINNTALTSLAGLENLQRIGFIFVLGNNSNLQSLEGLSGLTRVGFSLLIGDNDALTSLEGLSNLTSIDGSISIFDNALLTSLNGLQNVTNYDDSNNVNIENNPALDCSPPPVLPFVVDTSTGNAVNCN